VVDQDFLTRGHGGVIFSNDGNPVVDIGAGKIVGNSAGVIVLDAAALAADSPLAGVLVGTPVTPAFSADTVIISNIAASGDMLFAVNRGGNSEAFLHMDASAGVLYLTPVQGGLTIGLAANAPAPEFWCYIPQRPQSTNY
jgi:hypothetical protein